MGFKMCVKRLFLDSLLKSSENIKQEADEQDYDSVDCGASATTGVKQPLKGYNPDYCFEQVFHWAEV